MARDEDFLRRWSRRKRAAEAAPAKSAPETGAAPTLPSLDSLTFESDFKAFMHSKVEESVKRAALKKLFSDPRFNVIDPLDIDIDDYSKLEKLPEAAAATLEHARRALFGPVAEGDAESAARETPGTPASEAASPQAPASDDDGSPRQDA